MKNTLNNVLSILKWSTFTFSALVAARVISFKIENEPIDIKFGWQFWILVLIGGIVLSRLQAEKLDKSRN